MIRQTFLIVLAAALLTGCKKDPPADWRSPLGSAVVAESFCTPADLVVTDATVTEALADGGGRQAVRLINDRQITGAIESITTKLIDDNKTTKASLLIEQLTRDKCQLTLTEPGKEALTSAQVYEQCAASVLVFSGLYKCDKCTNWHAGPASGFVITEDGVAVTNHHVVDKANNETFVAMTIDGKVLPVKEVLAASKANDLAIVQLDLPAGMKLRPLAIAPNQPVGSPITLISHPDRRFYTLTTGIISRYHSMGRGAQNVPMVTITADYARGSSGAPVLNDRGAVIGIVASTHSVYYSTEGGKQENLQMVFKQCIPAASLMSLIEAN